MKSTLFEGPVPGKLAFVHDLDGPLNAYGHFFPFDVYIIRSDTGPYGYQEGWWKYQEPWKFSGKEIGGEEVQRCVGGTVKVQSLG